MHLDRGELFQNVGRTLDRRPVELHVLTGAEVRVALVLSARNMRQLANLARAEQTVRNGDA